MGVAETNTRTTLLDVARTAGVSVATVDRVLNGRAGVRARSVERVHAAVQQLNYRPDPAAARLARQRLQRVAFVLPSGTNSFIALLREQITESGVWLQDHRAVVELVEVDVFEPQQVAGAIAGLQGRCDAAIVMAMDHPLVRNAIGELDRAGIPVVTLVSDVPSSARVRYVGIDNVAAGRTAGTLLGRFCAGKGGAVGIIVGSPALRDHAERVFGFTQVLREHYPAIHRHCFSPPEIKFIARKERMSFYDVIARLKDAGLMSIPGGGAEILSDRIRKEVLDTPGAVRLGDHALVGAVLAHECEILGERRQGCPEARGLGEMASRRLEIRFDLVARRHLDGRDPHGGYCQAIVLARQSQLPCHWTRRDGSASVHPRRATEPRSTDQARDRLSRAGVGTALAASDTRS